MSISPEHSILRTYKPLPTTINPFIEHTGFIDKILCKSQVYLRLRKKYYKQKLRPGNEGTVKEGNLAPDISPYGTEQFEVNLKLLVDSIRDIGAVPILLIQPRLVSPNNSEKDKQKIKYKYVRLTHEAFCRAFKLMDSVLIKVVKEKDVELFDLSSLYTGRGEYFRDHIHLNPEGSKVVSEALADYLENILIKGTK